MDFIAFFVFELLPKYNDFVNLMIASEGSYQKKRTEFF